MAGLFLDSSALVKKYVAEIGSSWVASLIQTGSGNICFVGHITAVEVLSAIHRRARTGSIPILEAQRAEQTFRADYHKCYRWIPIDTAVIFDGMDLAKRYFLRAYDAIQLATALIVQSNRVFLGKAPITFVSADANLNAAAASEGLIVDDPNLHP